MIHNCKMIISQEPCIIWLPFMVEMCRVIISRGVFFNVEILIFQVLRGLKGKEWPKMTKISVCCTLYFRNHLSYDLHLWCTGIYKRIVSPGIFSFFFFFKILIFGVFRVVKGPKNDLKLPISVCFGLYLRNCRLYHQILIMISTGVFLYFFFFKCNIVIIDPLQQFS